MKAEQEQMLKWLSVKYSIKQQLEKAIKNPSKAVQEIAKVLDFVDYEAMINNEEVNDYNYWFLRGVQWVLAYLENKKS